MGFKHEYFESSLQLWVFQNFQEESLRRKDVTECVITFYLWVETKQNELLLNFFDLYDLKGFRPTI